MGTADSSGSRDEGAAVVAIDAETGSAAEDAVLAAECMLLLPSRLGTG